MKLACISLPHAVNMTTLESFPGRLGFRFDPDKKTVFLENSMNGSQRTWEIKLVLDNTGAPCRVFLFELDNSLFQRPGYCPGRPVRPGLFCPSFVLRILTMGLRPSPHRPFRDVICPSDLLCTSYPFFIEYDCLGPDLHCCFHPQAPVRCS